MASCKECIHYEACKDKFAGLYKICVDDPKKHLELRPNVEKICETFKDKSRYIELPCNIGDTVYYITGIGHNLIKTAEVKEIIIDKNGIKDLYVQGNGYNFENSFEIFFLTYEEAEQKLKEREDD